MTPCRILHRRRNIPSITIEPSAIRRSLRHLKLSANANRAQQWGPVSADGYPCRPRIARRKPKSRNSADRIQRKLVAIEIVKDDHIEGSRRRALVPVPAYMKVIMVIPPIGQPINQRRIAMEGENNGPISRKHLCPKPRSESPCGCTRLIGWPVLFPASHRGAWRPAVPSLCRRWQLCLTFLAESGRGYNLPNRRDCPCELKSSTVMRRPMLAEISARADSIARDNWQGCL